VPWKIVNLDYAERPHLHLKDPNAPIHLRTFFADQRVEIGLGADDPEDCFVRATVTPDDVVVQATKFEARHIPILSSILTSLDVEPGERDTALAWMQEQARTRGRDDERGMLPGNIAAFPPPSGWPYDLADDALLESLGDRKDAPHTRVNALLREARRRGLRGGVEEPTARGHATRSEPEVVVQRRPRRS
jgi:hypothetical protein